MESLQKVRVDKFVWAIRLYKTRSLAAQACQGGMLKLNGHTVKPSHAVKRRDVIASSRKGWSKTYKVVDLLEKRVGAVKVPDYAEDITPPEEYQKAREARESRELSSVHRDRVRQGRAGRPTKRDRRQMEEWFQMHSREQGESS